MFFIFTVLKKIIYLLILFLAALGLRWDGGFSLVAGWGPLSSCAGASRRDGHCFSCGPWAPRHRLQSVQSRVWLFATPWTIACQVSLSITNSWSLPKLTSIESVMPCSHLILCRPLLLPSIFSQHQGLFKLICIRWPNYWSFNFSISASNEYSGLISFRMYQLELLEVQGTLKSLLHTIVQKHQFFGAQLSLWSTSHIHTQLLEKP